MEIEADKPVASLTETPAEIVEKFKSKILEQLDGIANCLNDEDLAKDYTKKDGKINWKKMREIMRNELAKELKEEWESMWGEEELTSKLITLKTLANNTNSSSKAWRPTTGNINPQKLALEKKKLLYELQYLKKMHAEKESQVSVLKAKLTDEWNEIKEIRQRICEHNKTMDVIQKKIADEFEAHYQSNVFNPDSLNELKKDIQDTTLQGYLDDILP